MFSGLGVELGWCVKTVLYYTVVVYSGSGWRKIYGTFGAEGVVVPKTIIYSQ